MCREANLRNVLCDLENRKYTGNYNALYNACIKSFNSLYK
ncbi:hypothetical protein HMPREF9144_0108 [Prevotella pallens ATCC 700821]|uniref:Uncharacterized protein n=1 Tax=Prevotella pallens ATCC 700821 TaxID=997353 RepID=F9DEL8_9BACT|nr:hypothetical protein HMPREF9144_0108 [Prevotella pallens ATCC 700821]